MISGMNRAKYKRGQLNTALTVHGLLTIHGPNLNWYANIVKCKNVLNMGYINHKNKGLFQNSYGHRLFMALVT